MSNNPAVVVGISAVDNARQVLQGVDDKIKQTTDVIDQAGTKTITKWQQMKASISQNSTAIATSVASLGAGIVGFATSFGTIEKAQASANSAQITYEKSLQRLEKLQASGKATAEQLALVELEVANNADKLKLAQDNVNDTYTNFLANVPSQMLAFGTAFTNILKMTGVESIKSAASLAAYTVAMHAHSAATSIASAATNAFRLASIAAFVTNPAGAAIIGIVTLVTLLATNVGGLRDRVFELGSAILEFLDRHFKPLADAIRWFLGLFDVFNEQVGEELPASMQVASGATDEFSDTIVTTGRAVKDTTFELETLQDYLVKTEQATIKATTENYHYLLSLNEIHDVSKLSNEQINLAANYLRDVQRETERAKQENFDLVATQLGLHTALSMSNDELARQADMLRNTETAAKTATTALEALAAAQNRAVITQHGRQVGIGGTVSVEAAIAAGFGNNATIMQSAQQGTLGGVFVAGKGRVLDKGGTLFEDVIGFGTRTGTPHMLHAGEDVVPRGRSAAPQVIELSIDGHTIASALVPYISDALGRKRRIEMRITHEAIHGVG